MPYACKEKARRNKKEYYDAIKQDPERYAEYLNKRKSYPSTVNRKPRRNYHKAAKLRRNYGLDLAEYFRMYGTQHGCCKLCGQEPPDGQALVVDHCHESGKVRALLCSHCNLGLGHFRDNPDLLRAAAQYVTNS